MTREAHGRDRPFVYIGTYPLTNYSCYSALEIKRRLTSSSSFQTTVSRFLPLSTPWLVFPPISLRNASEPTSGPSSSSLCLSPHLSACRPPSSTRCNLVRTTIIIGHPSSKLQLRLIKLCARAHTPGAYVRGGA
jgi:hypothetical protein